MSFNELMQSLQMFQQGMGELATGRAVRGAADMAQQINMNEKDEFEKRRQLTQIGTGLAAQLSAMGTNQAQIQSSVGAIMPQQLQGPQDFFQQAAMAKTTDAKNQYQQAGQQIQQGLANAPLTTMQKEQVRLERYKLLNEMTALQSGKGTKDIEMMAEEDKQMVTQLAKDSATRLNLSNAMKSFIDEFDKIKDPARQISFATGRLPKLVNSVAGGLDAVGKDEYDRIMSLLEPVRGFNMGPQKMGVGRDLEGFRKELGGTLAGLQGAVENNFATNQQTYAKYGISRPIPKFVDPPKADKEKEAMAQQVSNDIDSITTRLSGGALNDADRLQALGLLERLKAKKQKMSGE